MSCSNCYIESSPLNDRLAYIEVTDVAPYLDELAAAGEADAEIGFTGGEPFMNPSFLAILGHVFERRHRVLVLTNAMRPMMKGKAALLALKERHGARLGLRVSLDHYDETRHAEERGARSWAPAMKGLVWLARNDFVVHIAGRTRWGESEAALRAGYARLFATLGLKIDAHDPRALVLFPELDARLNVPEISQACLGILHKRPDAMMCMVVKPKGEARARLMPCTLLAYDDRFALGETLAKARGAVALNHPHCARFCVLGGGSSSG